MNELKEKLLSAWSSFKSLTQTALHVVIAVGALVLVIHSWILLSNGRSRDALGALVCVVMGAVGSLLIFEQWIAAANAVIHAWGIVLGRVDRKQSAKEAATCAGIAVFLYLLLLFGAPIAMGFGFPAPGIEERMLWGTFYVFLANHALRFPERLRLTYQAATIARAAVGAASSAGGIKL